VRAQVRFVRAPQNPNEQFLVGVELEAPANVWRVTSIPKDWLKFPVFAGTAESMPHASTAPAGPGGPDRVALSPDQLLHVLEKHLRQAAEQAVASAVTSQVNAAVNQSITAIDKFSQASVRQVKEHCVRYQEKLVTLASEEVLRRLQAGLTQAEERLQKQLEVSLTEFENTVQDVTKSEVTEAHLVLAESVDLLKNTARELQDQFSTRLRETTDQAAAELSAETVRFSDRQLALLAKQAQVAIREGSTLLETRAAEAPEQRWRAWAPPLECSGSYAASSIPCRTREFAWACSASHGSVRETADR